MMPSPLRTLSSLAAAAVLSFAAAPVAAQARPATLQAGAVAPDFVSKDLGGREVRLADYLGKVVVLDFWATWCGPCKASLPHVQEVARARKAEGVVVLAVCTSDTRAKFEAWVRENAASYPDIVFTCDPFDRGSDSFEERASAKLYKVEGLPTKFVIGRDGKIALTVVGHEEGDLRLEAGLARGGIAVEAALATKGEEQAAVAAKEAAASAAAAAKRPPFWPVFGAINAGEPMPDFELVGPDGQKFALSSLRGKPVVLAFVWAEIVPHKRLRELAQKYAAYGVQVVAAVVSTPPDEFQQWLASHDKDLGFRIGLDPAGKYAGTDKDPMSAERQAYEKSTVLHRYFPGNMRPAMPAVVAADAEGRLLGAFSLQRSEEALGNLLLHAGVKLAPEHLPEVVVGDDAFVAPKPAAPEAPVTPIAIGSPAPDFVMQEADGKEVKLSDYRGKVVVLDFWATWCGPCKAALPHVQELATHYRDQGVVVLASCTMDARAAFVEWVRDNQAKYPNVLFAHDAAERSPERAARRHYGVSGIPHQFVIDRDGKVAAAVVGYMAGEVLLDAALAKAGVVVDAATLEKAAADQKKRDERVRPGSTGAVPLRR